MTEIIGSQVFSRTVDHTPALVHEVDGVLLCTAIDDITHDVRSFTFAIPGGSGLDFDPGQYLTLNLPVDGAYAERCYTISSTPTRPEALTITVKRVPGGPVSNWLHDHLSVGDTVFARGPFGDFSLAHHPADHYLFLSAGSGITPTMSMLRSLVDRADSTQVTFVHSARTPDDIIFRAELAELAGYANVNIAILCEDDAPHEVWEGPRGRLNPLALLTACPQLLTTEIFTCGPPPYMAAVRELADLLGVDPARYHQESFLLGADDTGQSEVTSTTSVSHQVTFQRSGRVIECAESTPLLTAAAHAGLSLASSCGEGVCGTCKLDLLEGDVDMQHAGGIRPREIAAGKILMCCSTPCTDLVIDA
ncbi:hybrid-cluster NAD(P)-dependent oxidoreductase [Demetria terragena]|uniref:hybrid-cluster NAD(P)-dependent oxidoreductase n=1 Tax=Demetria terragena TaxID=63959 RepID=UPI0003646CFB|nr:hybrid-cluster NAD(P)-dependent oxidoreductase [Demetria terragena]